MPNLTLKNIAKVGASVASVAPGLIDELYFAPIENFLAIPDLPTGVTDIDVFGLITDPFTFTAPKGFLKISDVQPNTGKFMAADQGGQGFGNMKISAEVQTVGYNSKMVNAINQLKFQPGIALVKLMNGKVMVIGTEKFPAYIKQDYDSATNQDTGINGVKISVEAVQPHILTYNYPTVAITIIT